MERGKGTGEWGEGGGEVNCVEVGGRGECRRGGEGGRGAYLSFQQRHNRFINNIQCPS